MNDRDSHREGSGRPRRDGSGSGRPRRDGDRPHGRGGDRPQRRDGDRPERRDGDRPYRENSGRPRRDSADRPRRDGDRPQRRDGDRPYRGEDRPQRRDGERPYRGEARPRRDGDGSQRRDGDRPRRYDERPRRDGDRPQRRDGDRPYRGDDRPRRQDGDRPYRGNSDRPKRDYSDRPRRDGERSDRFRRDGDRPQRRDGDYAPRRDGDRPRKFDDRPRRDGDRPQHRDPKMGRGGTRGGGRSDRGGRDREFTEAERLQHELRPVRAEHEDPPIPDYIEPKDLNPGARNELKTLQPETAEWVARHLVMVAELIDEDPELAHQHAISASRRAGRIPVVRETLAATAYRTGDYALALRELRTHRRLSGDQGNIALMVEAERALARPQKGIETGLEADTSELSASQRVQLAIAMSGARLDLGQTQQALFELEIPELDPSRAFSYSPELFAAYAAVLEDLGREAEAKGWQDRAERAEAALNEQLGESDQLEVIEVIEYAQDQIEAASETPEISEVPEAEESAQPATVESDADPQA